MMKQFPIFSIKIDRILFIKMSVLEAKVKTQRKNAQTQRDTDRKMNWSKHPNAFCWLQKKNNVCVCVRV